MFDYSTHARPQITVQYVAIVSPYNAIIILRYYLTLWFHMRKVAAIARAGGHKRPYIIETMHSYIFITYVMLIWAAPIPADRWHCSLWP